MHRSGLVSSIVLKLGLYIHTFIVSMMFTIHGVDIPPHAHAEYSSFLQPCLITAINVNDVTFLHCLM